MGSKLILASQELELGQGLSELTLGQNRTNVARTNVAWTNVVFVSNPTKVMLG